MKSTGRTTTRFGPGRGRVGIGRDHRWILKNQQLLKLLLYFGIQLIFESNNLYIWGYMRFHYHIYDKVPSAGIEPTTDSLEGWRSIHWATRAFKRANIITPDGYLCKPAHLKWWSKWCWLGDWSFQLTHQRIAVGCHSVKRHGICFPPFGFLMR